MKKHVLILFLPTLLAVASALLLIRDFQMVAQEERDQATAMASAKVVIGDVKRKSSARMRWFDVNSSEFLYKKDTIRTAKGSEVVIELNNEGGVIELSENSLIVLNTSEDRVTVDFVSGNLLTKGNTKGLSLRAKGLDVDISDAAVQLSATEGEEASLKVDEGQVKLTAEDGQEIVIEENQKAELTEEGVGEIQKISAKLLYPELNDLILAKNELASIRFQWESLVEMEEAKVEIANDRDFESIVHTSEAVDIAEMTMKLQAGTYYWRLTNPVSSTDGNKFEIRQAQPVRLIGPLADQEFRFRNEAASIVFKWIGAEDYNRYRIDVSADAQFQNVLASAEVSNADQKRIDLDQEGRFFWRVTAISDRANYQQKSRSGVVRLRKYINVEPPVLMNPQARATLKTDGEPISFRWESADGATGYQFELSRDKGFDDILVQQKTQKPYFAWDQPVYGKVHWRVSAFDEESQLIKAIENRELTILMEQRLALDVPESDQKYLFLVERPELKFSWNPVNPAEEYLLKIASDIEMKQVLIEEETNKTQWETDDLDLGNYYWQVSAKNSQGMTITQSSVRRFTIQMKDVLAAPTLLSPEDEKVYVGYYPKKLEVDFKWNPVNSAKNYEVIIQRQRPGQNRKLAATDEDLIIKAQNPLAKADDLNLASYRWSVRTVDQSGRSGPWADHRNFKLELPALLPPPKNVRHQLITTRR